MTADSLGSVRSRLRAPLGTAAGLALATLALRLRDPHQYGSWGLCPFKLVTGWDCPACGGLRAVNDLTHGDLIGAWHSNALFIAALPAIAIGWLLWVRRGMAGTTARRTGRAGGRSRRQTILAIAGFALILGFTVWRNTPWGSAFHAA